MSGAILQISLHSNWSLLPEQSYATKFVDPATKNKSSHALQMPQKQSLHPKETLELIATCQRDNVYRRSMLGTEWSLWHDYFIASHLVQKVSITDVQIYELDRLDKLLREQTDLPPSKWPHLYTLQTLYW